MQNIIILNTHPIQYFAPLYKFLKKEGVNLEVWYCSEETINGNFDKGFATNVKWDIPLLDGYPYRFFRNYSWKPSIYSGFFGLLNVGVLRALWRAPKSVIWVHGWANFITIATIISAKLKGHTVYLRGESPLNQELLKPRTNLLLKKIFLQFFLFKLVDRFLFIGFQNKAFYKYYGVKEKNLIFMPYCVDNERFQLAAKELIPRKKELRVELGLPSNSIIILYSGKYIPKKRPLDLLEAYNLILLSKNQESSNYQMDKPQTKDLQGNTFCLVMVGDGQLRPQIENYIIENRLENVFLTGFINQTDIVKYYAIADIFVMCSEQGETWGLSVNEAMNFGLPIIISDLTGCGSNLVKHGINGFIYKTKDFKSLSVALKSAINLERNESINIVNNYSFAHILFELKKLLN